MDAVGRPPRMGPSALAATALWFGCLARLAAAPTWSILASPCPEGMRYLTLAEAQTEATAICAMIDDWTIVEVGSHQGPGVGGNGYQCSVLPSQCGSDPCTQSVCTPGKEGEGLTEGEDIGLWAIAVFVCLSLYVGGGVGWHWHTQGEIMHPHVSQWKQVGGLVKDGVMFVRAKHAGTEFTPGKPADEEQAPLNPSAQPQSYGGGLNPTAAASKSKPEVVGPPPESPSKKTKTKKKKKKKKKPEEEDGEAKE
jgi:hypothetical protein